MKMPRLLLPALAMVAPTSAFAQCKITKFIEFPVTMSGRVPLVPAKFGDQDAHFILDSGAFYSTLSRASAAEFGQRVESAPSWFRLSGIGGDTSAGIVVSKNFALSGVTIPNANFVVGGSDMGRAGLIGQNILGIADVEYDLPHGAVRLMKTIDCGHNTLAYWAGTKPVTMVRLDRAPEGPWKPHTVGTVLLNGVKIKAIFDSGAQSSLISLAAAKRAGVTPQTPGVVSGGVASGLGTKRVASWVASFDTIDIGGEAIRRPKIRIGDVEFANGDMLIGADFFLTHRMFVSNANHAIFITYEGGPVFGLSPTGAMSSDGTPLDLTSTAGEPTTADAYSRRAEVSASNHRLDAALADLDKACALVPGEGRYFYQRAIVHFQRDDRDAGRSDLDRSIALIPAFPDARMTRARLRLHNADLAGATEDIVAADHALTPSSDKRLGVAGLYNQVDRSDAAIVNYDLWLKSHPEDSSRAGALNGRCWARGLLNRDLDKALPDCNAALKAQPNNASYLDSRALVRLRRGELPLALADYDRALTINPRNAWSLYMRSIVERRSGNVARSTTDGTLALSLDPQVAERARKIGFTE